MELRWLRWVAGGVAGAFALSVAAAARGAGSDPQDRALSKQRPARRLIEATLGGLVRRRRARASASARPSTALLVFRESSHGPGRDCFRRQPATEPSHPGPPAAHSRLRTDGCRLRLRCRREDAASDCRFGSTQPWRRSRAAGAADTDDSWSFVHAAVSQGAAPTNHPERLLSRSGHSQRAASAI